MKKKILIILILITLNLSIILLTYSIKENTNKIPLSISVHPTSNESTYNCTRINEVNVCVNNFETCACFKGGHCVCD